MRISWLAVAAADDGGRLRSSGNISLAPVNGTASTASTPIDTIAIGTGRRMTIVAIVCQRPVLGGTRLRWRANESASMRGPTAARMAGRTTIAPTTAIATTQIPA